MANLKRIQGFGWGWLTRLKANRQVNPDRRGLRAVAQVDIATAETIVPQGDGLIRLFKSVTPDGDMDWWASYVLQMTPLRRVRVAGYAWPLEPYHHGIKPLGDVERTQVCAAPRNATTSVGVGVPSCAWSAMALTPALVGLRSKSPLSGPPCRRIWPIHCTPYP